MYVLEPLDIYYGIIAIVAAVVILIIGMNMILKYFKYKISSLIFIGFAIIGLGARNWPKIATFISIIITKNPISTEWYFIIGFGHSIGLISWMIGWVFMTEMKTKNKNLILIVFFLFELIYLLIFYMSIFLNLSFIGSYVPAYNIKSGFIVLLHSYIMIILLVLTISKTFLDTRKTNNKEIRYKGDFIVLGMLILLISGLIDLYFEGELFYSIGVILGVFTIYIGTVFPKWIKKILLKNE